MIARVEVDGVVPGAVLPIDRYLVDSQALWKLGHGGTLYLVAEGPAYALYLVAVLEQPERSRIKKGDQRPDGWYAAANAVPVTDISGLRRALALGRKQQLANNLATPRLLDARQEAKLRAAFDDDGDAPVLATTPAADTLVAQIDELLALWRTTRAPEIADVIDRATRLLPRYDRPLVLDSRDQDAGNERWLAAWHHERGEAMPQLVRNLPTRNFAERLQVIADAPPDPRIVRYLSRRIHAIAEPAAELWIRILRESRDPVAWRAVAHVLPELAGGVIEQLDRRLAFTRKPPRPTPLTEVQRAHVRAIDATLADDPAEAALIDAIAEHPDEDDPYLIYSDWLLERGHPRGEYIALACQKRRGGLSPALARRLGALESVPFLFGALDEIATQRQRPRPRGIDRELIAYWTTMNETWIEVARHPLVRALEALSLVGIDREERIPGLAAFVRAAPRLRSIAGFSQPAVQRALAKELGWRTDDDAVVRGKA